MRVHLVNPSDLSFGTAVITPRWLYVLAAATPAAVRHADDRRRNTRAVRRGSVASRRCRGDRHPHRQRAARLHTRPAGARARRVRRLRRHPRDAVSRRSPRARRRACRGHGRRRSSSGDRCWPTAGTGRSGAAYDGGRDRGRRILVGALGPAARRSLHVGLGADGARLPEALLVLLGLAHRRAEAAAARRSRRRSGDRRAPAPRLPVHAARRRQLLSGHAAPIWPRRERRADKQQLRGARRAARRSGST